MSPSWPVHPGAATKAPLAPAVRHATPRWVLWCSAGLAWTSGVTMAILFALVGHAIGEIAAHRTPSTGLFAGIGGLALVAGIATGIGAWLSQWAASQTERRLRQALLGRMFQLGPAGASVGSGELLSLATNAVERAATYRASFLGPIVGALTTPLLVLAVMAIMVDATIAGWLALLIILVPLAIGAFQRLVRPVGASYRRSQARLTAAFLEAIQALDTLVYARAAQRTAAQLARRGEQHRRSLMRILAANQLLIFVVDAAFSLAVVTAAAVLVVIRVHAGTLSLGDGIAVLAMTVLVIGPVDVVGQFFYIGIAGRATQQQLSSQLTDTASGVESRAASETVAYGQIAVAMHDQASTVAPESTSAGLPGDALVLADVTAAWPHGEPVLRSVSLQVRRGERVVLVGPSGVGKSTVSALLQAHLLPAAGQVLVDGLDTRHADPAQVRSRLAVVEQRPFLFLGSVAENLRLAAPGADDAELWQALELAGFATEVRAMAQGLHTPVGERGRSLSGGQAQRLAIARASLRDAPILILDEPTSQVDLVAEVSILAALHRLAAGRTVLMIAHRPGAILAADRVIDLAAAGRSSA